MSDRSDHRNARQAIFDLPREFTERSAPTARPERNKPTNFGLDARLDALTKMPSPALRAEWRRLFKSEPPERIRRDLLVLAVDWKMQTRSLGGLSAATRRRLTIKPDISVEDTSANAIRLKPGTRLVREWHGIVHEVDVLDDGFVWNDQRYASLSKIAHAITGAHWSGPRFFGLKAKARKFGRNRDRDHV